MPSAAPCAVSDSGGAYSSTQTLAALPRPTRPRNWCSCARPKRSACSMTISAALGTSTPTSITVVATSTGSCAGLELRHHGRLLGRRHAAVQQADIRPGSAAASAAWVSVTFCRSAARPTGVFGGAFSASSTPRSAGRPSRPGARAAISSRMRSTTSSRRVSANTRVTMGVRPGRQLVDGADVEVGEQRHRQRARDRRGGHHQHVRLEPSAMASLVRSARRCCTPKRCCSSMMARPSFANAHLLLDDRVRADDERRLAAGHLRHRLRARLALAAAGEPGHRRCPAARASRPASQDAARPGSRSAPSARTASRHPIATAAASAATTVLPEPTSPCSRRCIGTGRARSACDLVCDAPLRRCQAERQARRAALVQSAATRSRTPARAAARARAWREAATAAAPAAPRTSGAARPDGCGLPVPWHRGRRRRLVQAPRAPRARSAGRPGSSRAAASRRGRRGPGRPPRPCAGRAAAAAPWSGRPASATAAAACRLRP